MHYKYNEIFKLYVHTEVKTNDIIWDLYIMNKNSYVISDYVCWNGFNICTLHRRSVDVSLTKFNNAVRLFTSHHLMYFNYNCIEMLPNSVDKYIYIYFQFLIFNLQIRGTEVTLF